VNVREIRTDYDRNTKLPAKLVEEFTRSTSEGHHAWAAARQADKFEDFQPLLTRIVELNRERAACFGWAEDGETWDALAEGFEPGLNAKDVSAVFGPLRKRLVALIEDITQNGAAPSNAFNEVCVGTDQQMAFVKATSAHVGFDYDRGRLDTSAHPFCSGTNRDDVRMTTRFGGDNLNDALGSTLHESGHGLYEQNLPGGEHVNTPLGQAVGLSVHESQSRMIENQVGRSKAFWDWRYPGLGEYFGAAYAAFSVDEVYTGANRVAPSLIRVEADEATYNLHIMIRFELERVLLNGELEVVDLPGAWNEKYKAYLGVDVPSDAQGCLQDIHWSMGAMGYFPTYTMGNLYAAQFFEKATDDLGGADALNTSFAKGEFGGLVGWLNENIHSQGKRYRSAELCQRVTGKSLSADPLMRHLENKLRPIYGI
jgi:carboxypeptidase Taq